MATASAAVSPGAVVVFGADESAEGLVQCVSGIVADEDRPIVLLTVAVAFYGDRIRADEVHSQLRCFEETTPLELRADGDPARLGEIAADWLTRIGGLKVTCVEWEHEGRVYAGCYVLEEYGAGLVQFYNRELEPPDQAARLEAEDHAPNGWVDVIGIGPPSRLRPVATRMA
ncbi:MAG TPA: hypothetical protein VGF17_08345 [Phytomonospora sp.]